MSERLRARDLPFLTEESATNPRHNMTVDVFRPGPDGFDFARFAALVADRLGFVPRYRQRLATVSGQLANPVWVDDPGFDLDYHVRRSALPRPGTVDQLRDLVARIAPRPLDRTRPLWEIYVVEGLEDGNVAILHKTHQVLVDGVHTVDLGQVLLDEDPHGTILGGEPWTPEQPPSPVRLLTGAVLDNLTRPDIALETVRSRTAAVRRRAARLAGELTQAAGSIVGSGPDHAGPLAGELSQQRRVAGISLPLADHREIRDAHGGTVNDVILATIAGGLRDWLMTRGESLAGHRRIRALVPVSVIDRDLEATSLGSQITGRYVDLPVAEASPVMRLHQVSYSFQSHHGVAARRLAGLSGFAAATFHAIGSRLAAQEPARGFTLPITNVPGPQSPLYAAGARMTETYAVHPLLPGQALALGVTSYDGTVFYTINADRNLVPDVDVLAQCVRDALEELVDASGSARVRAPRGAARRTD